MDIKSNRVFFSRPHSFSVKLRKSLNRTAFHTNRLTDTEARFWSSADCGRCRSCQQWPSHPAGRREINHKEPWESCHLQKRGQSDSKCRGWKWKWGRNNQFSDISKCALDDAYLNRPETVCRDRGRMRRTREAEAHGEKPESPIMKRNWSGRRWRWN